MEDLEGVLCTVGNSVALVAVLVLILSFGYLLPPLLLVVVLIFWLRCIYGDIYAFGVEVYIYIIL